MANITQVTFYPNEIQYCGFDPNAKPSISGNGFTCSGGETSGVGYDVVDNRRSAVITLDTDGETALATFDFDLYAAITNANFLIIDNNNLKTADAKVLLDHGGVGIELINSWFGALGSALAKYTVTPGVVDTDGIALFTFANTTDDNWEVSIDDVSTFDADVTIGELIIGKRFTPATNCELGEPAEFGYTDEGVALITNKSGKRYALKEHSERRRWNLEFRYVSASDLTEFQRIFRVTRGCPLYVSLDSDSATPTLYRVRIMNAYNARPIAAGAYEVSVYLEEEL